MARIIDRLTSNFDSTKFGTDKNLSNRARNFLNTSPINIATWAKNDLANGSINRTDYFQNPVLSIISSITSNINSIISVCVNDPTNTFSLSVPETQNLANSSNTLISELLEFSKHTNRISGASSPSANIGSEGEGILKPDFASCISVGSIILMLTANTDGVSDTTPILNNFTSLYIETELQANNSVIGTIKTILTETDTNTLTPVQLQDFRDKVNTTYNLIHSRRTSDENFFQTSQQIADDFQFLNSLQNTGSTERNLINSKIGTTRLKNNLIS